MNKIMTEAELQFLEHCNKIMQEHKELIIEVTASAEIILNDYVPKFKGYVEAISEVQYAYGKVVANILQSTRELKIVTANAQEIINFTRAVHDLDKILTVDLVEKLKRISNVEHGISQ